MDYEAYMQIIIVHHKINPNHSSDKRLLSTIRLFAKGRLAPAGASGMKGAITHIPSSFNLSEINILITL